jgi:HlyD family secretion protein
MSDSERAPAKSSLGGMLKRGRARLVIAGALIVLAGAVLTGAFRPTKPPEYKTEAIRRTTVTRGVSASGALDAVDSVTIGSEISGQVRQVLVDFNAPVKKGELLAVIDTETYDARVRQAQAALDSAAADARVSQSDYDRQKRLFEADLVAEKTMQDAGATRDRSAANLRQAQAALESARSDLAKANIRSPIDGVVVNRTVDPGQTVAASLNAPELFIIAKDLSKLQIKINVDEADIGQVAEGQPVRFTVDAFPDETFEGRVTQVRKSPEKIANVVTYVVVAQADNAQHKLLPGMTANADIVIEEHPNVLAAPATALRWKPSDAPDDPTAGGARGGASGSGGAGGAFADGGPGAGGPGGGFGGGFGGGRQVSIEQSPAFKDIALDDKQKEAIKAVAAATRPKMVQAYMDAGGDRQKMRDAMQKLRKDADEQISALLRPDQQTKYAANRAALAAQFGAGGANRPLRRTIYLLVDGKPRKTEVLVGANDGTLIEVSGKAIKVGDLVITGGGDDKKGQSGQRPAGFGGGRPGMMPFGGA